jgi:hypothetical protein
MPAPRSDSPATPNGQRTLAALSADQLAASRRPILEYISSLIRTARWQLLAAVLIMAFTSLTEGLGVALLFPILQVAGFNLANHLAYGSAVAVQPGAVGAYLSHRSHL